MSRLIVRWKMEVFAPKRKSGKRELIHTQDEEGNSIVGNFISVAFLEFLSLTAPAQSVTLRNTANGLSVNATNNNISDDLNSPAAQTNFGLLLGTGNTPVTIDDYKLANKIAHGAAAGQLLYGLSSFVAPVIGTNPRFMQVIRAFSNGAAGAVVVQEAGLHIFIQNNGDFFLIERSVISPFNIPPLGAATATSSLGVTV